MEKLSFKVAEYDAPLDLILHLIAQHKLNILDIDISSLLEQYMAAIESWQAETMEVASEFLAMASRLVHIKTVSLLPRHEEETERLKQELTGQLIEYQLCKIAAQQLGAISRYGQTHIRPPEPVAPDQTYTLTHPASLLYDALISAYGRGARHIPPPQETFAPLVTKPVVSVTGKIFGILRRLRAHGSLSQEELFAAAEDRSSLVATFLAALELIRSGKIVLENDAFALKEPQDKAKKGV